MKEKINEKLKNIKEENSFDESFLNILSRSNITEEISCNTADKVVEEIEKRYAKNKEN